MELNNVKFTRVVTTHSSCGYGSAQFLYIVDDKGKVIYIDEAGNTGLAPTSYGMAIGDKIDDFISQNYEGKLILDDLEWEDNRSTVFVTSDWNCVTINNIVVLSNMDCHMDFIDPKGDSVYLPASAFVINLNPQPSGVKSKRK